MTETRQITIAATFTAEPIADSLAFWADKLGLSTSVSFAPYNQVFQELLTAESLLSRNRDGFNTLLVRMEDWQRSEWHSTPDAVRGEKIWQDAGSLVRALQSFRERSAVPCLVVLCPPSPRSKADENRAALLAKVEQWIANELQGVGGLQVVTSAELIAAYPAQEYYDPAGDELGHIPYTTLGFAALGTMVARKLHGLRRAPYKVIVSDCDEVLWKGICGEVGGRGVEIDEPRRKLQEFLVAQHDAGMLICLCSKNSEQDVWEVFAQHAEMPLKRDHLVSWRINWESKSQNLKSLAKELNLGLDSFVFLDDNPLECADVQANCPGVLTLQLPAAVETIPQFLCHVWPLDRRGVTEEDGKRTLLYRQNVERERLRETALTLSDFLAGLELKIRIDPVAPSEFARVAQLTQRTNQFNCTAVRRSEEEIRKLCASAEMECLVAEVSDRFGEYGLVGALMLSSTVETIRVDTFLLSCRVLGRGVEHRMLRTVLDLAESRGAGWVEVPFLPTAKNQPALDFLQKVGAPFRQATDHGLLFRFPANAEIQFSKEEQTSAAVAKETEFEGPRGVRNQRVHADSELICQIAVDLRDSEQIHKAIQAKKTRLNTAPVSPNGKPRTPVEESIVAVWSEVLGIENIGIHDNFFSHLGGDSLRGTQVISRMRHIFQLPLELRTLFDTPTVAGLAIRVLENLANTEHGSDVAGILAELEENTGDGSSWGVGDKVTR